jgi:IclR family transcriptional regulator, KDG regulon repressor
MPSTIAKNSEHLSSVHNAIRILGEFSDEYPELGITELSERLSLPKSTIYRLLQTLKELNLISKNEFSKKYGLGLGAAVIGSTAIRRMNVRSIAFPYLFDLMQHVRRIVRLGVYDVGAVVYLSKLPENKGTTQFSGIGQRSMCHNTAIGKVLLAFQKPEEIERVLHQPLQIRTAKTIVNLSTIRKQLNEVRETGYALTHEEAAPGICSIAVPIYDHRSRVIAAISLTGSKSEFLSTNTYSYLKEMRIYSRLITQKLEYVM